MMERRHIQLDGLRLSYLEQGAGARDAQTLVLVHGLMGCAETFVPLMQELGPEFHLIALDLPGSGLSERREDIDATLASNGELLAGFLQALGLRQAVVLGHSHGGAVAMRMAAQHRALLHSLVLLAPAHPWFDEGDPVVRFYLSLPGRLFAYAMPWFPQWLQMMGLRRMAGPQSWDTPERLRPYRESLRIKGTISHLLKLLRTWHQDMAGLRRALRKPLATPTLILWGDADRAVPVASAEELRSHLLRSDLHVLPGVGHRPAEERPAVVAALITDWLKQNPSLEPAESLRYKPSSSVAQPRIAALMASSLEAGD
jgi:pimeloyl-ACP methyl ester carboxylesterase